MTQINFPFSGVSQDGKRAKFPTSPKRPILNDKVVQGLWIINCKNDFITVKVMMHINMWKTTIKDTKINIIKIGFD